MNSQKLMLIGSVLGTVVVLALWYAREGRGSAAGRRGAGRGGRRSAGGWTRDPAPIEAIVWLVGALLMAVAPVVGAGLMGALPEATVGAPGSFQRQAMAQSGGYALGVIVGAILLWTIRPRATERTGLRVRWSDAYIGALGLLLVAPVYMLTSQVSLIVSRMLSPEPSGMIKHETLEQLKENPGGLWSWLMIVAAVIGAPIVEELTYRMSLQSFFRRLIEGTGVSSRAREVWMSIFCTSGLFALTHLSAVPWSAVPSLFVFGVALGIAYERTGRLGVPIVMHALFNAANVAAVMLGWVG